MSLTQEKALYAAAGDPKNLEAGKRPYWLLQTLGKPRKLSAKSRSFDHPNSPIIKAGRWAVRARWYLNTSVDARDKRRSYRLLPELNYIEVSAIIQEHDLEFQHAGGRQGSTAESTLGDTAHDRIMKHNFATYK